MQKFTNLREIIQDEENNYIFERLHRQCLWRRNCGQRQCRGRGGGGVALTKSPKLFPLVILQPIKPFTNLALLCIYKSCFINWKLENVLWLWTLTGQLSFQGKKSLIRKAKGSIFFASESFFKAFHQNFWQKQRNCEADDDDDDHIEKINVQDAFYNEPTCAKIQTQRH